ncbi:hypothetical protein SAMN05192583_0301 [Sphingomonas gellani]|uniref:Uncharacterized protein n=1 Tax=Sphingomonas gellani TaxID=1166340 RepID=A0A1H7YKJ8_9SPHN|nr:hypothetical protein [Sphingomonas gellani]SEM46493.1 hypothetical protein SAMN05192583_0301 [Sphingomonas gellani]
MVGLDGEDGGLMQRPPSIVTFERLYLASIALGLANTSVGWTARRAMLDQNPAVIANPQLHGMLGGMMAGLGALGALGTLMTLIQGHSPSVMLSLLSLLSTALSIAAAVCLFRVDALPWFGETPDELETVE